MQQLALLLHYLFETHHILHTINWEDMSHMLEALVEDLHEAGVIGAREAFRAIHLG
jgi:hypothetical protein